VTILRINSIFYDNYSCVVSYTTTQSIDAYYLWKVRALENDMIYHNW